MRIFEHMNTKHKEICPICGTKEDKPVVLVGVDGTEDGHNIEAIQIHVECIRLNIREDEKGKKILYMVITKLLKLKPKENGA